MDHHAILSWADGHLNRLETSITDHMRKYPYALGPDYDDQSLEYQTLVMRIGPFKPPDDWVFLIGDTLHNMRVALDYLAFTVVKRYSAVADESKIAFPIFDDPGKFAAKTGSSLKGVPPHVLAAFEALQPYPGNARKGYNLFLFLDEMENVHKHRHLLATFPGLDSAAWRVVNDPGKVVVIESLWVPDKPLVDGAPVVRIRFNGNREAKVQSHQTFHIFFDKTTAGGGVAVIRTLKNIRKLILEVIFRDLEKLLV